MLLMGRHAFQHRGADTHSNTEEAWTECIFIHLKEWTRSWADTHSNTDGMDSAFPLIEGVCMLLTMGRHAS